MCQNVHKYAWPTRKDDRNSFSFHRDKLVNRCTVQPVSIRCIIHFLEGSTEANVLYFTVDSL